jgi:hypothetical protein
MDQPGFKVMHMQGYDNYSTCLTLEACFSVLADWSRQNPGHALITVTLNLKDDQPFPGTSPAVPFDNRLLDEMDRLIAALFERETVFTPDDLRGAAPSLKLAVRQNRWPTRSETRGQFMFVIDEETPSAMLRYREGHPSLRGRMMWATFPETEEEAAFINIWNIRGQEARARALVEDGFLVRTAADIGTAEARRGDRTRLDAAIESGAQFIATDFYPGHISDIPTDYIASFKDQNLVQCPDL